MCGHRLGEVGTLQSSQRRHQAILHSFGQCSYRVVAPDGLLQNIYFSGVWVPSFFLVEVFGTRSSDIRKQTLMVKVNSAIEP